MHGIGTCVYKYIYICAYVIMNKYVWKSTCHVMSILPHVIYQCKENTKIQSQLQHNLVYVLYSTYGSAFILPTRRNR